MKPWAPVLKHLWLPHPEVFNYICNPLCVGLSKKHTNDFVHCSLIMPGSFVLIPKSTCTTWESVDLNINLFWVSHLCKFGRGRSGSKLMWILSLIFSPKWVHHTHLGHLGKLWCKLPSLLPWLWIYLGVPDPWVRAAHSVNPLFPSGWRQLSVSKPLRSPTAHGSRVEKRDLEHLLAPSSQKFTNSSKTPWLCLSSEINSARASSVSPRTAGANRNGPWTDFYTTHTLSGKALAVLVCSSAIYLGKKWFPSFPGPCPGSVWFTNTDTDCVYLINSGHLEGFESSHIF